MKRLLAFVLLGHVATATFAQVVIRDQPAYAPALENAFSSLQRLDAEQMRAVAGLVLAAKAGFVVDEFCPPLKQFSHQRWPCESAMISYARAKASCKKADPTWKDCPKVLEAEANWAACETKLLGERLQAIELVRTWPRPSPQPKPIAR